MERRLCSDCLKEGPVCMFDEAAEILALQVAAREISAEEAHYRLTFIRENARDIRKCPELNNVNPDYIGKSGL